MPCPANRGGRAYKACKTNVSSELISPRSLHALAENESLRKWVMPEMMKAALAREFHELLRIEELRIPAPHSGKILIKVAARGVCRTDLA